MERARTWLIWAAMVTPPWNIFWWAVGGGLYWLSGGAKNDHSGDVALGLVLFAPVTIPGLLLITLYKTVKSWCS
jgi:hypothetical protein